MAAVVRRVFGWWPAGAGLAAASAAFLVALRMAPPAFDVARACALVVALILAGKVIAWVAVAGATFGREERLLAFVMLAAVALGWLGAGELLAEREFDYRAAEQKAALTRVLHDTSMRLTRFCDARARIAPPRPRPATWQADVDAIERFEDETVRLYERGFAARVREVHDQASLRGLRDRDLDAFFRHPANQFQMRVIATRLDAFSQTLARSSRP